jgi:LmbE family N-acetylglucosaminyl deacetylase
MSVSVPTIGARGETMADTATGLPRWRRPLVVVAHPDDESFGLGALVAAFVDAGANPTVLCFTHGEASTLHGVPGDLHSVREGELRAAAQALNVRNVELHDEPDGALGATAWDLVRLAATIERTARYYLSDGILTFDLGGVTRHPDHDAATSAAIEAARQTRLDVLGWTLPDTVTAALNTELATSFVGRSGDQIDLVVRVRRDRQLDAVRAHPSQAVPGSALWRRLELLGDQEHLRWLVRSAPQR